MTETENMILVLLRQIRATQEEHGKKIDALDERLSNLEIREGHSSAVLGQINLRLLKIETTLRAMSEATGGMNV